MSDAPIHFPACPHCGLEKRYGRIEPTGGHYCDRCVTRFNWQLQPDGTYATSEAKWLQGP